MFRSLLFLTILLIMAFGLYGLWQQKITKMGIITYIRDGDVWLANMDGSGESKITSHEDITYKYRNYINGEFIEEDENKLFNKLPKISRDGKYLVFLTLSKNYLDKIKDWKTNVRFFSDYNPNYSEFDPPEKSYEMMIFNIGTRSNASIPLSSVGSKYQYGNFNSLLWSRQKNVFSFIKDFDLHVLFNLENKSGKFSFETNYQRDFCSIDCGLLSDEEQFIKLSPDGTKVLSSYNFFQTHSGCNNTVGSKIKIIDLPTRNLSLLPEESTYCTGSIGDWFNDNLSYVVIESYANTEKNIFVKRAFGNNSKTILFKDNDYQFRGPISISPDDKWVAYPLGKYTFGSVGSVDLRIRNLFTLEYFDILEIVTKDLNLSVNRVMYPNWDSKSGNLYFQLSNDDDKKEKFIVKLNVKNKRSKIVLINAEQVSISN